MKKSTATIFLLSASLIWGISFVVMKGLLNYLPVNHLLAYRFSVGAIGLSYVLFKYKTAFTKKSIIQGFLVGLCMYSAFVFQTYGLMFIGSGKNALITAVYVILVPLLMWVLKKYKPSIKSIIAACICFAGIAVLSVGSISQSNASEYAPKLIEQLFNVKPTVVQMELIGIGLTLISGVLYAVHIAIVNIFGEETPVMPLTFMQYLFAAILAWISALLFEKSPDLIALLPDISLDLIYVCFFSTLLAFTFQNIGVKNAPPAFASIILCLESLFGCILSIIFTSEKLTWNIAVGAVIIMSAILISEVKIKKTKENNLPAELTENK